MKSSRMIFGCATLALAVQAHAAEARVTYICPELDGSELKVRIDSGCMSTSTSYAGNDLALEVDQGTATISVTGGIEFNSGGPIHTADCMGATSFMLTAQDIEVRNYTVLYNGSPIGEANFIEDRSPKQCLGTRAAKPHRGAGEYISSSAFKDWNDNPVDGWRDWRGESILGLLSPVLDGHPEGMEGRPEMWLEMRKASWHRPLALRETINWREPFIMVSIRQKGYLDDSVSAGRYAAAIRMDENGKWKIDRFWSQDMCARGENAGQWTGGTCP